METLFEYPFKLVRALSHSFSSFHFPGKINEKGSNFFFFFLKTEQDRVKKEVGKSRIWKE